MVCVLPVREKSRSANQQAFVQQYGSGVLEWTVS
jgi:hypothetical protein